MKCGKCEEQLVAGNGWFHVHASESEYDLSVDSATLKVVREIVGPLTQLVQSPSETACNCYVCDFHDLTSNCMAYPPSSTISPNLSDIQALVYNGSMEYSSSNHWCLFFRLLGMDCCIYNEADGLCYILLKCLNCVSQLPDGPSPFIGARVLSGHPSLNDRHNRVQCKRLSMLAIRYWRPVAIQVYILQSAVVYQS